MKGTRLWNQPRSPLIQGRSSRQRPFWRDWLVGLSIGALCGMVSGGTVFAPDGAGFVPAALAVVVPAVLGAAAGAASGVPIAAGFGWHPRWVAGAVLAVVLSVAVVATGVLAVIA